MKKFNLTTLISLLVGVISLVVVIPTISAVMNKKPKESPNYRIMLEKSSSIGPNFKFEIEVTSTGGPTIILSKDSFFPTYYPTAQLGHFIVYYDGDTTTFDFYQPKNYTLSFIVTLSYDDTYYRSSNELIDEGIYDFTHYVNADIENNDALEPTYTPW